jgi:hypothetical protein
MSCYYPCLNPKAFGPFGPCPPPWIYGPPCPPSYCCDKKDDCCDKLEPGSIALNETLKYITNPTNTDILIDWNHLLQYNTFVINLENETDVLVTYNLYLGADSQHEPDFIKNYKKKNCIDCLGHGYITNQIYLKLVGYITVNVYKNNDMTSPIEFSITNDFYKLTPHPLENDLTSHYHIFSVINDSLMPSRQIIY